MNFEQLKDLERAEFAKRDKELCLIPSEGLPSESVLEAQSSIFALKYAEGRATDRSFNAPEDRKNRCRYYCGCQKFDEMELKGEDYLLELFEAQEKYNATIQPHSGSQANQIVYGCILQPNDTILSMDVACGSHISHNSPLSFIGKYHNVISYGLDDNGIIDYEQIEQLALENKPKLIIVGISAYSREVDFKRIKEIADKVGAYTMADIAHITALVISGLHQNPIDYDYDFITMTCHKQLNGPRGGCILYKKEFEKGITRGILPFIQGGGLGNMMYAKTVRFEEILDNKSKFKEYSLNLIKNSKAMFDTFINNGIRVVSDCTENHMFLLDLSKDNYTLNGKDLANIFEEVGIISNCNAVKGDVSFLRPSGLRVGSTFLTARGLSSEDFKHITQHMSELILLYKDGKTPDKTTLEEAKIRIKACVHHLTSKYPLKNIYPKMYKRLFEQ